MICKMTRMSRKPCPKGSSYLYYIREWLSKLKLHSSVIVSDLLQVWPSDSLQGYDAWTMPSTHNCWPYNSLNERHSVLVVNSVCFLSKQRC